MSSFWKRLFAQSSFGAKSASKSAGSPQPVKRRAQQVSFQSAGADDKVIRLLTPDQAAEVRTIFLTGPFQTSIEACLAADETLNSATLLVGQYWCDEAVDAVGCQVVWSQLETPDLQAAADSSSDDDDADLDRADHDRDHINLDGRAHWNLFDYQASPQLHWADNTFCISLFAGFCVEGGHQEGDFLEFESPVAVFRRTGPKTASMTFVGEMVRPWLDGVAFYYSSGDNDFTYDYSAFEKWAKSS